MTTRRYGREKLDAYQLSAELLVLGGESFSKDDLRAVSLPQQPVLVQPDHGYARADELAQLQTEVQKTIAQQTRTIRLRRIPYRNRKQWMLNGKRLLASEVSLDDRGQPFVPRTYASVEEALQQIVFELDAARSGGSDNSSSSATLEN